MPQLPKWTDAQAVSSYVTSILAFLVTVVAGLHPGFHEPAIVQSLVPSVGLIVAGIAQAVNVATHRSAHAAAIKVPVVGPPGPQGEAGPQGAAGVAPQVDTAAIAKVAADAVVQRLAAGAGAAAPAA